MRQSASWSRLLGMRFPTKPFILGFPNLALDTRFALTWRLYLCGPDYASTWGAVSLQAYPTLTTRVERHLPTTWPVETTLL
jgi:hypothetical protein